MCAQRLAPHLPFTKSLFMGWFEPLRDRIAEEQRLIEKDGRGKCKGKQHHAEALEQLSADKIAVVTMHTVMAMLMRGGSSGGGAHYLRAALEVGEAVEHEARIERLLGKKRKNTSKDRTSKYPQEHEADSLTNDERVANKVSKLLKNQKMDKQEIKDDPGTNKKNIAKEVVKLMKNKRISEVKKIAKKLDDTELGGDETRARVGSKLIEMLVDTAYIQQPVSQSGDQSFDLRPAFHHRLRRILSGKVHVSCGFIECDPLVHQGLEKTARHMVVPYMPMLVPPLDWIGYNKGAYFFLPSYLMRIHGSRHQRHAIRTASRQQMQICYEALNTLGSIKWRINKRILGIVDRIWSSGGCLAGLVDREDVPLPEKPDTEDEAVIKKWRWDRRLARKENMERYSQRCDVELKLNVARKLKDEEGFYYPHNLDFRGRAYPMHPYMNHLGSDLCRGVLEFAEGRPLGKSGLRWLKIQLANVYAGGVDKLPLEGRVAFADSHIEDIFDSADRPLEGGRWWLDAEDPFQCLAVCINLAEALRTPSPESAISHLPVHQDGSCNGLQHYAALGRDKVGAAAVNLIAGEKPADVYTEISKRVLQNVQSDAEKDPAIDECAKFARFLIDQVDRKLVKQTVMTSVYGVTFIGAKEQVRKRLRERGLEDDALLFASSTYAARLILTTLGEMFVSARQIMTWLGDCAKIISMENKPVKWVSRVGLPIVQPYLKKESKEIKTSFQIFSVPQATDEVLARRQRTAFPPNFVHSLDGSHMMMTAIACKKAGLNFAGVHDSFWTHACDVDTMNRILREKFVELYEAPVLENQLENFRKEFPLLEFPPLPPRGDLDIRDVLSSTYFFN